MSNPEYSREKISVVRFEVDPERDVGESICGYSFPIVLSKVNKRTILGKLRFFLDDRTKCKVFLPTHLPKLQDIENWLSQCRQHLHDDGFYPRLILAESKTVIYELHYSMTPDVGEALSLLDNLVELALKYADIKGLTSEQKEKLICNRSEDIRSFLHAISNDSLRTDDASYEHWSEKLTKVE